MFTFPGQLKIPVNPKECQNQIKLSVDSSLKIDEQSSGAESYTLTVKSDSAISIIGSDCAGVFYGIQSLLSLIESDGTVPECVIEDKPRYGYRGMHLDVSRNFHTKDEVFKLLDVMAMYKMNKFHFHLTDDEGWRLEIPGLDELTQVCTVTIVIIEQYRGVQLSSKYQGSVLL